MTERRRSGRTIDAACHGIVQARVRPGHEALVVDVSAYGALIETAYRLLPGRQIELQLETADQRTALRGQILRCAVARVLPTTVSYRGAIRFEEPLAWFVAATSCTGYPLLNDAHAGCLQS